MTIQVDHVSKFFDGQPVLDNFCMELSDGNSYLLTGPSGSGKTTLLRILLGLTRPDSGRVRLLGDYKYSAVHAGVVFQEDRLCEPFSAVENVAMVSKKLSPRIAREALEKLLPEDALDKSVRELSGGMRRRVAIVRALCVPSDVLLFDEPFTGLDRENRKKAIDLILAEKGSVPLLITGHSDEDLGFCHPIDIRTGVPLQMG